MDIIQLQKIIFENYSFNNRMGFRLLRDGVDNSIFLFYDFDGNKNIARIGKRKIGSAVDFEVKLIKHLVEYDVAVPPILKTLKGKDFVVDRGRVIICFNYIDGRELKVNKKLFGKSDLIFNAGQALGKFHSATINYSIESPGRRTIYSEMNRVLEKSSDIKSVFEGADVFIKNINLALENAKKMKSEWGIIHNDYNSSNVLFKGSEITAILDFDWSCSGPLLMDVGYGAMTWSTLDKEYRPDWPSFNRFLDGYNSNAPRKVKKDRNFYFWTAYSCLYLAANTLADALADNRYRLSHTNQVWMYQRYKYYISLMDK